MKSMPVILTLSIIVAASCAQDPECLETSTVCGINCISSDVVFCNSDDVCTLNMTHPQVAAQTSALSLGLVTEAQYLDGSCTAATNVCNGVPCNTTMNEQCKNDQCVVPETCSNDLCGSDDQKCIDGVCKEMSELTECGEANCDTLKEYCFSSDVGCVNKTDYFECGSSYCITDGTIACKDSDSCVSVDMRCARSNDDICDDGSSYAFRMTATRESVVVDDGSAQALCVTTCADSGGFAIGSSLILIITTMIGSFLCTAAALL